MRRLIALSVILLSPSFLLPSPQVTLRIHHLLWVVETMEIGQRLLGKHHKKSLCLIQALVSLRLRGVRL